jgi:hypothetical protein
MFIDWVAAIQGERIVPLRKILQEAIQLTVGFKKLFANPDLEYGNMKYDLGLAAAIRTSVPEASRDLNFVDEPTLRCSEFKDCREGARAELYW